ncbi:MAG TPA: nucleoside phosphorylase [Acidimicrobiia bacterium]|nr:nucleoside phosphorylase [Acidimicrobiia bacterium]
MDEAPILDFDADRTAVIEPSSWFPSIEIAPRAIITWMTDVYESVIAEHRVVERHLFQAESAHHPILEITYAGTPLVVVNAGVGAPLSAALFEVLIALGCTTFMACGSAGGLVAECPPGTVIVPESSVRDEGVSYHYAPAASLAVHDPEMQSALAAACRGAGFSVDRGSTWTTDALFRETRTKVADRIARGCVAVEMEAAALATVAQFRRVRLGHAVYVADTLHGEGWDATHLVRPDKAFRRRLFDAAAQACLAVDTQR